MHIAFLVQNFTYRGTEVALFDYALYNRTILNNTSTIVYPHGIDMSNSVVIRRFSDTFEMVQYHNMQDLQKTCDVLKIDAVYTIKYGRKDDIILPKTPTLVHCVFEMLNPHGHVYAGVSPSVARGIYPHVPHIVDLPNITTNFRSDLEIPENATVFGRHGGEDTFNISWVKTAIISCLEARTDVWFLFCVRPAILSTLVHPRVLYFDCFADKRIKRKFINTCDAMIHASSLGESFGLSVLEFSACNKPVITWNGGDWHQQHLAYLDYRALKYSNQAECLELMVKFDPTQSRDCCVTSQFAPDVVMQKFKSVFLENIIITT